jgi:putative aldouronate transport system permease protein
MPLENTILTRHCFKKKGANDMRASLPTRIAMHSLMTLYGLFCILPFLLLVASSVTSETEIQNSGYTFFPSNIDFIAYQYLFTNAAAIIRAYGVTVLVTVTGTVLGLLIMSLLAYPMSRKDFPMRSFLGFYVFFTLLFNGGLVPTYLLYTNYLDFKNTIWALIIPILLVNAFFVIIIRTFFTESIPVPIIESAYIDGAGEWTIFFKLIMPLSLPVLATVGLFQALAYWNDWFNGLIFLTDPKLYSLQNMLNRILLDIEFLKNNSSMSATASLLSNMPTRSMRMAIAVIGVIPIMILYPFLQKYFVKGLTLGAVKG